MVRPSAVLALSGLLAAGCPERAEWAPGQTCDEGASDCVAGCGPARSCARRIDAGAGDASWQDAPETPDARHRSSGTSSVCGSLDVVFVLDVSTSMGFGLDALEEGIRDVWAAARGLGPDPRFSLVVFVDDALAVDDCAPFDSVDALSGAFERWRTFCSYGTSPVSGRYNSDNPENSLDALHLAATACPFREGATHIVIHVTDATFVEHPARLSVSPGNAGVAVEHTFAEVAVALTEAEVRLASFHHTESFPEGLSAPWAGQPGLVEATGGHSYSFPDVVDGRLDLGAAIRELFLLEHCTPYGASPFETP